MEDQTNQTEQPTVEAPAPEAEQPAAPRVFVPKRVNLEHGDTRALQTADINQYTTVADLLDRAYLPKDGKHLVLDNSGQPLEHDEKVYDLFKTGQKVQIVRHPDHPRRSTVPTMPLLGSHDSD